MRAPYLPRRAPFRINGWRALGVALVGLSAYATVAALVALASFALSRLDGTP